MGAFLFGTLLFTGSTSAVPLNAGSILLLLLGLHWWAMMVKRVMQHRKNIRQAQFLSLVGLAFALVIPIATRWTPDENILVLFLMGLLITWLWQHSIQQVQRGLYDEQLFSSFKVGLFVLLAVLLCVALLPDVRYKVLLTTLAYALPIFFLSGLLALSFSRLGFIHKEYAPANSSQANPTQGWLLLLTFLWLVLVATIIVLQTATFQPVLFIFSFIRNTFSTLLTWLIALIGPLFASQQPPKHVHRLIKIPHFVQPAPQPYYNPFLVVIAVLFMLAVFLVLLVVILRAWSLHVRSSEDEEREGLAIGRILKARRQKKQRGRKYALQLPLLAPDSARLRYREFLQATARKGETGERQPAETPSEYQARLLTQMNIATSNKQEDTPSEAAILQELTHAYIGERYGGKQVADSQMAYLRKWVPHLVRRV